MQGEKFTLMQYNVNAILGFIEAGQFVIPEIQRPFVWKRAQVRDLIDSLYNGYPTGYIITWKNPDVKTTNSPAFNTFLAAQINLNCNSLFMHGTMISDLINISGDVHHIFPKAYLKNNGIDTKGRYNQVANFTYLDTQVNKAISDDAPNIYFQSALEQCDKKNIAFGNIFERDALMKNLSENAIPESIVSMTVENYDDFLADRRKLMAKLMMRYYKGL